MKSRGRGNDYYQEAALCKIIIHRTAPGTHIAEAIPRVKNLYVSHGKRQTVYTKYISTIEISRSSLTVSLIPGAASPHCGEMQPIVNLH